MVINLTPHSITIIDGNCCRFDAGIRKWVCDNSPAIIAEIPSSGVVSARVETAEKPEFNLGDSIPIYAKRVVGCDPLPAEEGAFIVSALYACAYYATHSENEAIGIYTIADPVYTPDGKTVVGCKGISPYLA